ncbi:hypothetical protein LDENG_00129970, partial [Lucifuga dentata]
SGLKGWSYQKAGLQTYKIVKYLGIPQSNGSHDEEARRSATAKCLQRVRQVLRSQLNGRNKIQAINMHALPVIRYPAGIISWPQEEMVR